jgi:hypothetical protein
MQSEADWPGAWPSRKDVARRDFRDLEQNIVPRKKWRICGGRCRDMPK